MAKLHSYYVLCPLIDQKSFLGVSQDKEKENVIVTLGRNVVNTYRLTDQKQIGGWTSKDHITSAVVYDEDSKCFVGVFNNNCVKTWTDEKGSLEKIKKYKFRLPIWKLIPRTEQSVLIVFTNGNCVSLSYGLDNCKTVEGKSFIKNNETLVGADTYTSKGIDYVCYVTRSSTEKYEITYCPLRSELGDLQKTLAVNIKVEHPEKKRDLYVVGTLIFTKENPVVYVLWNDSKMTVFDLTTKQWRTIGTVPWMSTTSKVSLAWMGEKHLILFGSNIDQDGAIVVAYNTSLGVGSCRYPMKMYTDGAKLYCFDNRIVMEASNHIGMMPYVVEVSRSLSSLVGSHEVICDEKIMEANWGTQSDNKCELIDETKEYLELGLTERAVCANVLLPHLEKDDHLKVHSLLKEFNDIPETVLVKTVQYVLRMLKSDEAQLTDHDAFGDYCRRIEVRSLVQLLNYLLQVPFCDALVIPYLRSGLTLKQALFLMTYICDLLVSTDTKFDSEYESKLFDWCILLMDSFYQQFLMCKDEEVTKVLDEMLSIVTGFVEQFKTIDSCLPLLNKLLWTKSLEDKEESSYTIEMMEI